MGLLLFSRYGVTPVGLFCFYSFFLITNSVSEVEFRSVREYSSPAASQGRWGEKVSGDGQACGQGGRRVGQAALPVAHVLERLLG